MGRLRWRSERGKLKLPSIAALLTLRRVHCFEAHSAIRSAYHASSTPDFVLSYHCSIYRSTIIRHGRIYEHPDLQRVRSILRYLIFSSSSILPTLYYYFSLSLPQFPTHDFSLFTFLSSTYNNIVISHPVISFPLYLHS